MNPSRFLQFVLLCIATVAPVAAQPAPAELRARADVDTLTGPAMRGRGYLDGGHERAARYIRDQFKAAGLDGLGTDFMQTFTLRANEFSRAELAFDGVELIAGADFILNDMSGSGSGREVPVVNAESGVVIPPRRINQFGADVEGAVVVFDDRIPPEIASDSTIDRRYLTRRLRVEVAELMGARAVVVLVDRPTGGKADTSHSIPVFELARDRYTKPAASATFAARAELVDVNAFNVAAMVRGTERPDSVIMFCGHYDHLGGLSGDVYFPGANDNASGTAMLLSLARHFREHPLRYSVAFVLFSGEEAGLLGSRHFAEHPLLDLARVRFLVNLDMAASGRDGIMAVGGMEFAEEFGLLREIGAANGIADVRKRENAPNSDHFFILRKGVRGFYIYPFTGLQPYHHVADRPATLEWDVFMRLRSVVLTLAERISR